MAQTPWQKKNGQETRVIELSGRVELRQYRKNGKISTIGIDKSGHGAVGCAWEVYVEIKLGLEICSVHDDGWGDELSEAIEKIMDFVVANSMTETSRDKLELYISNERNSWLKTSGSRSSDSSIKRCEFATGFLQHVKNQGRKKFRAHIEKLLSVPRIPVKNPCL